MRARGGSRSMARRADFPDAPVDSRGGVRRRKKAFHQRRVRACDRALDVVRAAPISVRSGSSGQGSMRPSVIAVAGVIAVVACASDLKLPSAPGPGEVAVLVGAGDIAVCGAGGSMATGRLLDGVPGTIFIAGDIAYPDGTAEQFQNCYDPAWGRHKDRTRPTPGNHEYGSPGAAPYFAYFGANAGPAGRGYYRYSSGTWQVFSLNSNTESGERRAQIEW